MKVAVSVPESIFGAAEQLARERQVPRSQLYAEALREYVERHSSEAVTAKLNQVYGSEAVGVEPAIAAAQIATIDDEAW